MSHFAFVNPGGPLYPPKAVIDKHGLTRLYWQANDEQVSAPFMVDMRGKVSEVGIMRDPIWGTLSRLEYDQVRAQGQAVAPLDAPTLAQTLSHDLTRLGFGTNSSPLSCYVLADIEIHNVTYLLLFLKTWRELRPSRATGWTLEPHQGGWFTPDLVRMLMQSKVTVFPQAFYGDQSPADPDWTRCDVIERGIPRGMVVPVYSALHLPQYWDGIAFRFDQLP